MAREVGGWDSFRGWLRNDPTGGTGGKSARPFCPVTLYESPGPRRNANLEYRHVLALDADAAGPDYLDRLAESMPFQAISHTSASHTDDAPKWHTYVRLTRRVTPAESKALVTWLIGEIGVEYDVQASTSPIHVMYAPAWDGVQFVDHDGPVLDPDEYLMLAPPVEWSRTARADDATVAEFRAQHAVTDLDDLPSCPYGRKALEQVIDRLDGIEEGTGVHQEHFHLARRSVELVTAGCWSMKDLDTVGDSLAEIRREHRDTEWPDALAAALARSTEGKTACTEHREIDTGPTESRFPLLDIVGLLDPNRPPRQWLWDGVVPKGDHASIVAPAGIGKSLLVLAFVVAVLRGEEMFIGRVITAAAAVRVLHVDMENSEDDWAERLGDLGMTQDEARSLLGSRFFPLSLPRLAGLDTKQGAAELRSILDTYGIRAGDIVVLDSTQRVTEGDESDNDTMRKLYSLTATELKRRGITVIRTDNTGWDKSRERGASSKRDDVGYAWLLKPEDEPETFSLVQTKRRGRGDVSALSFKRTTDDAGRLVFEPTTDTSAARLRRAAAWLDERGVDLSIGQDAAWSAVKDNCPFSRNVIRAAIKWRKGVDSDFPEAADEPA